MNPLRKVSNLENVLVRKNCIWKSLKHIEDITDCWDLTIKFKALGLDLQLDDLQPNNEKI